MAARSFLISLLAVAIGLCSSIAGQPGRANAKDAKEKSPRLLETLLGRCKKMRQQQVALNEKIRSLHAAIESHPGKKPRAEDRHAALKLADDAKKLVTQATNIVNLLKSEGTAVAFPEAFQQLRDDMKTVQAHLEKCEGGRKTQAVGADIANQLREMAEALKTR